MPIAVVPGSGIPTQPGQPTPVVSDAYDLTFFEGDGTEWPLMRAELGWHLLDALSGVLGAVPISIVSDADVGGGETIREDGIQDLPGIMTLPLRIDGPGELLHRFRFHRLVQAFTNTKRFGPGRLVMTRPDGSRRQIKVRYYGGLDPEPGNLGGWLNSTVILQLKCPDAYWSAMDARTFDAGQFADDVVDFQDPYFGLSSSEILGAPFEVINPGDAPAWPRYVITGPADLVTATISYDVITDIDLETLLPVTRTITKTWAIDPDADGIAHGSLLADETVTIVSRPQDVRGPDGSVWTAALGYPDNATLWSLPPGKSTVTISVTGADDGTSVEAIYLARYETP